MEMQLCAGLQEGIVDPQLSSLHTDRRKVQVRNAESQIGSEKMQGGSAQI